MGSDQANDFSLTTSKASDRAGVSRQAIQKASDDGRLTYETAQDGSRRFRPADVDAYRKSARGRRSQRARQAGTRNVGTEVGDELGTPAAVPLRIELAPTSEVPESLRRLAVEAQEQRLARIAAADRAARLADDVRSAERQGRLDGNRLAQRIKELVARVAPTNAANAAPQRGWIQRGYELASRDVVFDDVKAGDLGKKLLEGFAKELARVAEFSNSVEVAKAERRGRIAKILCAITGSLLCDGWTADQISFVMPAVQSSLDGARPEDLAGYYWPLHRGRVVAFTAGGWAAPRVPLLRTPEGVRPVIKGD